MNDNGPQGQPGISSSPITPLSTLGLLGAMGASGLYSGRRRRSISRPTRGAFGGKLKSKRK